MPYPYEVRTLDWENGEQVQARCRDFASGLRALLETRDLFAGSALLRLVNTAAALTDESDGLTEDEGWCVEEVLSGP
jgi:hypothetical protein